MGFADERCHLRVPTKAPVDFIPVVDKHAGCSRTMFQTAGSACNTDVHRSRQYHPVNDINQCFGCVFENGVGGEWNRKRKMYEKSVD